MSTSGRMIKITISHNSSQHELCLPAESTFGDVKRLLAHKTALEPKEQILIFRGKEKQDEEHLHLEGVKDNSEMFLFKEAASKERKIEEIRKRVDMTKASKDVSGVRAEVDQLSEMMAALEVAVNGGTNVADNEFLALSELLMRQLLKLDAIEAEGEARLQRKAEVCRVQSIVDRLDFLKEINYIPSGNNGNAFSDGIRETLDSGLGGMNAPRPMSSSGNVNQDLELFAYSENEEFELRGTDQAMDPSTSESLARRRGRRIEELSDLGAQVQEGTEIGATSRSSELEDPVAYTYSFSTPKDGQTQIEGHLVREVIPEISQYPRQFERGIGESLANGSFLFSRTRSVPARASISEDSLEEDTYVNVGEILRLISPSSAARVGPSVATNVAKSLAVLCELDDRATNLMEIAFNKYPNLMIIRSDRRKTFIRWMFCSLSNLLQLLSTVSASTLDGPKMSEIEIVLGELETFGFDAGFIDEIRLQVSEAWEARLAIDNATSELKTLCSKAEDLDQEITSMERKLAAAKAEAAQVENRVNTLCEFVEGNRTPIFKWIE